MAPAGKGGAITSPTPALHAVSPLYHLLAGGVRVVSCAAYVLSQPVWKGGKGGDVGLWLLTEMLASRDATPCGACYLAPPPRRGSGRVW